MGGYGSGQWRIEPPKRLVEDCLTLSSGPLQRSGYLRDKATTRGLTRWRSGWNDRVSASISFTTDTRPGGSGFIRLGYTRREGGRALDYRVGLTATVLPWGKLRWWFVCPLQGCGRRVAKLYLPPGASYFGCRHCHRLTYKSAQEAHKYDAFYRLMGREAGCHPSVMRAYFDGRIGRRRRARA